MKLSTRTCYGTRILVDLALTGNKLSLRELTRRQQVSHSYLQHIIAPLVQAGIIGTTRGSGGGVWLIHSPGQIKLGSIFRLLEGENMLVECLSNPSACNRCESCVTHKIWKKVEQGIITILDSITLEDLVRQEKEGKQYSFCPVS